MSITSTASLAGSVFRFYPVDRAVTRIDSHPRFVLWVDAVGAYLVCQASEVRLGQAVPGNPVEVPLLADISRHHATIRLDGESYLLEGRRDLRINGRKPEASSILADGALIELGPSVRLRFCRPHPLSATARLEFVSHHRTQPSADGVVLMADACVLGPGASSHVPCREWQHDVVIYRRQGSLFCRTEGTFEVDGSRHVQNACLTPHSRVAGERFSFSIEEI